VTLTVRTRNEREKQNKTKQTMSSSSSEKESVRATKSSQKVKGTSTTLSHTEGEKVVGSNGGGYDDSDNDELIEDVQAPTPQPTSPTPKTTITLQSLLENDCILEAILTFVETPKLVQKSIDNKRWKNFVESALQQQTKKSFQDNKELKDAVRHYAGLRPGDVKACHISDTYRIKCIYGPVINKWDVSQVTDFSWVFFCMYDFNEPIDDWDVSNATTMLYFVYV
jgi:Mycoplasma protein of unknown function, DUF285